MGYRVGEDRGVQPKSAVDATAVYFHHRAALEYDFRARFGFGVEKIDREELSWQQVQALIDGLLIDHSSHSFASVMGWAYVPTPAEVQFYDELDVKIAMNRAKNQPAPPRTKRPWEQARTVSRRDPEHDARLERLKARLGLA